MSGGVIANNDSDDGYGGYASIGSITGDFIGNMLTAVNVYGGVIFNQSRNNRTNYETYVSIGNITGDFIENSVTASGNIYGGVIMNRKLANRPVTIGDADGGIVNSSFYNNYSYSSNTEAVVQGAVIWMNADLALVARDNYTSYISGNYTQIGSGAKNYEAVYVDRSGSEGSYN